MENILLISAIVLFGGLVKGFAGFGYAVFSVGLLAVFLEPSDAVILMILPLVSGNFVLAQEMDVSELGNCVKSFWVLMAAVFAGTFVGMLFIGSVPEAVFSSLIGGFLLLYAVARSGVLDLHMEKVKEVCFQENSYIQAFSGFIGGFFFGSMSVGALIVSYLDYLDLDRKVFVGLLSFVLLAVSVFRIVFSWFLGYYSGNELLYLSAIAAFPGLAGVLLGSRIGRYVSGAWHQRIVLALFVLIGARLVAG